MLWKSWNQFHEYSLATIKTHYLPPIGPFGVVHILDQIKDKTTKDLNDISISFLKKIAYYIAEPLAYVYDLSISSGEYPDVFKTSKTFPVYKRSGPKNDMNNYCIIRENIV